MNDEQFLIRLSNSLDKNAVPIWADGELVSERLRLIAENMSLAKSQQIKQSSLVKSHH